MKQRRKVAPSEQGVLEFPSPLPDFPVYDYLKVILGKLQEELRMLSLNPSKSDCLMRRTRIFVYCEVIEITYRHFREHIDEIAFEVVKAMLVEFSMKTKDQVAHRAVTMTRLRLVR